MEKLFEYASEYAKGYTDVGYDEDQIASVRDAFIDGAKWQKKQVWHNGNDPADDGKEILFEWESFGEKYHDVGYYDKKAKAAHIIGGGRLVLSPTDRWAYLEDLTQL